MKSIIILGLLMTSNLFAGINMLSGQLSKVPVSRFFKRSFLAGPSFELRAIECSGPVGILLRPESGGAYYGEGSVAIKSEGPDYYGAFIFGLNRSTANCEIQWRTGQEWNSLGRLNIGGTLVEVGSLENGSFIEAHRVASSLEMVLFNSKESIAVRGTRINVNSDAFTQGKAFVLLGTTEAETHVDLVRGPLNHDLQKIGIDEAITLSPGRYAIWVNAKTNNPVGSLNVTTNPTRPIRIDRRDIIMNRGQLNSDGFEVAIEENGLVKKVRQIPLGAFGGENEFQRFVLEFDVATRGSYRIHIKELSPYIEFDKSAFVLRNPESSEFKIAELNMFYHDPKGTNIDNEYRNAADLLVTKGTVNKENKTIEERPDQAPYQLDADIAFLTENRKAKHLEKFREEAELRGTLKWDLVHADNEGTIFGIGVGRGGLFMNETLFPEEGIRFSKPHYQIDDAGDSMRTKWVIPAQAKIKRYSGTSDRPVTVIGVHMHTQDDKGVDDRFAETKSVIKLIKKLMKTPSAFNKDNDSDPRARGNRMVIIGDFNTMNHELGEGYWLLRELRKEFGFALDVSLAVEGSVENNYGMHSFSPIMEANSWLPEIFMKGRDWSALKNSDPNKWLLPPMNIDAPYPWYAKTFRGATHDPGRAAERNDMILLVGRGWVGDDAAREYTVVQDSIHPNPFSARDEEGNLVGGIEMYQAVAGEGGIPDSGTNYNPNYSVGYGTGPGRPALQTDHRPIAAKLRVFTPGLTSDR